MKIVRQGWHYYCFLYIPFNAFGRLLAGRVPTVVLLQKAQLVLRNSTHKEEIIF